MANKELVKKIKLQIPAGKATPAPPVGTVLGPVGINLGDFCTKYNDQTKDKMGDVLPVLIRVLILLLRLHLLLSYLKSMLKLKKVLQEELVRL